MERSMILWDSPLGSSPRREGTTDQAGDSVRFNNVVDDRVRNPVPLQAIQVLIEVSGDDR